MHLYKDQNVTVVYVDTGATFPHVREFVHDTAKALDMKLHVVKSDVLAWQEEHGWPVDVLPVDAMPLMQYASGGRYPKMMPFTVCCLANVWGPTQQAIQELGATKVIRGSKKCDGHQSIQGEVNGIEYIHPLWDWSDAEVFGFLSTMKQDLPEQYASGCDSLDCWSCTAYMDDDGENRRKFTAKVYPEQSETLEGRLTAVRASVNDAVARYVNIKDVSEWQR